MRGTHLYRSLIKPLIYDKLGKMIIKSLELKNFRNYRELELKPSPGINLILGENAQGKSNLMEALYILSTSRSFRALKEEELIKWDSSYAVISEEVS